MALFTVKKKLSFEDDIINSCLLRGSGFVNGKKRILELFNNSELSNKQRAKLICKEYGIGVGVLHWTVMAYMEQTMTVKD